MASSHLDNSAAAFVADDPNKALGRFYNALRQSLRVPKEKLDVMWVDKTRQMEEARVINGQKRRGPKPRRSLVSGPAVSGKD